ncbi:MAG: hypothetical protein VZR35_06180, partial [Lachnospiraceae bacterium]|nr:hypothetical protein [Lachnospiraceae bacterium]
DENTITASKSKEPEQSETAATNESTTAKPDANESSPAEPNANQSTSATSDESNKDASQAEPAAESAAEEAAPPANFDISITSVLIELTSLIMMIELVVSACRVRKLSRSGGHDGYPEQKAASGADTGI